MPFPEWGDFPDDIEEYYWHDVHYGDDDDDERRPRRSFEPGRNYEPNPERTLEQIEEDRRRLKNSPIFSLTAFRRASFLKKIGAILFWLYLLFWTLGISGLVVAAIYYMVKFLFFSSYY